MGKGSLKNKQSRRDRLLGLLKSDDYWTTHRLCEELEVSHRTLMRDLDELRDSGYPIESERGRGGGIRLDARFGIERLQLDYKEIISLLTSLAITESLTPTLISTETKSIRQKIAQSFPSQQRSIIAKFRNKILVGDPASNAILKTYEAPKAKAMEHITSAFFDSCKLEISYLSEKKEKTKRCVEPHFLLLNWPIWYLLCWDELRNDVRVFRTDRILSSRLLGEKSKIRKKELFLDAFERYFSAI